MTVEKLLELTDATRENTLCDDVKLRWICDVEGRILCEIFGISPEEVKLPVGGDAVLVLPDPYADVYLLYLVAMIEFTAGNYAAYSSIRREFENSLARYARYVIRTRK
jgi:hypothetical protein